MNELGNKIATKRKNLGITQQEFADELLVTRQTVSRWEAGSVMPDIDKIPDIAKLLQVSCDYLLQDDIREDGEVVIRGVSRLMKNAQGKKVKLTFFDGEADMELYNTACRIADSEGNWMKVEGENKKGQFEKLIPLSSVLSLEIVEEEA